MTKKRIMQTTNSLKGFCLISMPRLINDALARSVVLICSHDSQGAMGFMLNKKVKEPHYSEIYEELDLKKEAKTLKRSGYEIDVFCGGPIESGRGFLVHSPELALSQSIDVTNHISFTSTLGALKNLASKPRPKNAMIMLGYTGWGRGQLEQEIGENDWLVLPSSPDLIFSTSPQHKYETALALLGINEASLSVHTGSA